jgi:hypothetical protein
MEFYSNGAISWDITGGSIGVFEMKGSRDDTFQYFHILNNSNNEIARFNMSGDIDLAKDAFKLNANGTTVGLPVTFNGAHDTNLTSTTTIKWGSNNADAGIRIPYNLKLDKVSVSLTKATTSGSFDLEYELNGSGTWVNTLTHSTGQSSQSAAIGTAFTAGDVLKWRTNNNNSHAPTAAQYPTVVLWFTTNG